MASHGILSDVWTLIGAHLPPQHLFKLLSTSRQINAAVDNEEYWTCAAAQLIWRDCDCMEIHPAGPSETDVMPRPAVDLYDIPRAQGDYRRLMGLFFARMDEMRATYTKGAQDMVDTRTHVCLFGHNEFYPTWWRFWFAQPLHRRNTHLFASTAQFHNIRLNNDELDLPQKELARRKTLAILSETRAAATAGQMLFDSLRPMRLSATLSAQDFFYVSRMYKRLLRTTGIHKSKHWKYWRLMRGELYTATEK